MSTAYPEDYRWTEDTVHDDFIVHESSELYDMIFVESRATGRQGALLFSDALEDGIATRTYWGYVEA